MKDYKLRWVLAGVYLIGIASIVMSIVRVTINATTKRPGLGFELNVLMAEIGTHIIVASIPGILGLFVRKYVRETRVKSGAKQGKVITKHTDIERCKERVKNSERSKSGPPIVMVEGIELDNLSQSSTNVGELQSNPFTTSTERIVE